MVTPIRQRTEILSDPIAAWDEIEAGITFLEEEINAKDPSYVVTPFVAGTRTSTWVMTKAEIQGLEDRMHAVSVFLKIQHIRTVWTGLMPVGYNAMNHFILGLAPDEWKDAGYDPDDLLDDWGYPGIDWIGMFRGLVPIDRLHDLIDPGATGSALVVIRNTDNPAEYVNKSTDGGSTWANSAPFAKGSVQLSAWAYLGNNTIVAGFWDGMVKKSADGGATWGAQLQLGSESAVASLVNLGGGKVLAGTYPSAKVYKSSDYGDSWEEVASFAAYNTIGSMCHLGSGVVIACVGSGKRQLNRSTDYGNTWAPVFTASDYDSINTPVYLGGGVVLFVGLTSVYRSTDNGVNWSKVSYRSPTGATGEPHMAKQGAGVAVICISEYDGLGGALEIVYRTTDYGETWASVGQVVANPSTESISTIISLGENVLLACGSNYSTSATIYRSTDVGSSWELVATYTGTDLSCDNLLSIG